jgi:hypothetical protein
MVGKKFNSVNGDSLLVIRFSEEDIAELQKRVFQQKMDELFEEPSKYEDEDDDDY